MKQGWFSEEMRDLAKRMSEEPDPLKLVQMCSQFNDMLEAAFAESKKRNGTVGWGER